MDSIIDSCPTCEINCFTTCWAACKDNCTYDCDAECRDSCNWSCTGDPSGPQVMV